MLVVRGVGVVGAGKSFGECEVRGGMLVLGGVDTEGETLAGGEWLPADVEAWQVGGASDEETRKGLSWLPPMETARSNFGVACTTAQALGLRL